MMKTWLRASRAFSLTAVLAPVACVWLLGARQGMHAHIWIALSAIAGVTLLLLGVNLENDVVDDARGIDQPGTLGGSGVIQDGLLSARSMRVAAWTLMLLGSLLGIPAFMSAPLQMLWVGLLAVVGAVGYSTPPLSLKYRGLGDLAVFVLCGPLLTYGASLAFFGALPAGSWALGCMFGFAAAAILHANNMQDIDIDTRAGARTFASMIGPGPSKLYLALLYLAALGSWLFAGPWLGILGFIPALLVLARALTTLDLQSYAVFRIHAAMAHLAIGVGAALSLLRGVP